MDSITLWFIAYFEWASEPLLFDHPIFLVGRMSNEAQVEAANRYRRYRERNQDMKEHTKDAT